MIGDLILVGGVFLALLLSGLWIPFAVAVTAILYLYVYGGYESFRALGLISWGSMDSFTLTAIPLFIFMAELMLQSGLSHRVYRGLSRVVRRLPGGLLQTNIAGCAVFAAISGSSVATAAAIGTVALPQLEERHYDRRISAGTLAAGGTLGILIPPSIAMIIYGTFTETSIAKLFMAGVAPGLILTSLFMFYVGARAALQPSVAPQEGPDLKQAKWLGTAADLLPFAVLIALVMGSLYFGFVTPTEAAAVGCCLSLLVCLIWGDMDISLFRKALQNTIRVSGAILFIVYSAYLFSYAAGMAGLADSLTNTLVGLKLGKLQFLLAVFALYTILGCLVDSIGMMVITVPLLYPVLLGYGIDPLWFGVALVLLIELGQITPPLGLNLFVIQGISSGRLSDVIVGTVPFYVLIFIMLGLIVAFPELALWLPSHMSVR
jgi:C4-dicarboxylate transporter DctM subunit